MSDATRIVFGLMIGAMVLWGLSKWPQRRVVARKEPVAVGPPSGRGHPVPRVNSLPEGFDPTVN